MNSLPVAPDNPLNFSEENLFRVPAIRLGLFELSCVKLFGVPLWRLRSFQVETEVIPSPKFPPEVVESSKTVSYQDCNPFINATGELVVAVRAEVSFALVIRELPAKMAAMIRAITTMEMEISVREKACLVW